MSEKYVLDVKENDKGELYFEFPAELMDKAGWKIGDELEWKQNGDGSYTLTKTDKEWVLVECVSQFRTRYMVQVPAGKSEWALDTVTLNEASEFSQEFLGETIVSHRVIDYNKAIEMCDKDNDYTKSWDEDLKVNTFFTKWKDQNVQ